MTELLSSCRNYDNYRRAYGECTHFKIPILGVHLKDLISLYEAMPDYLEDGKVNVQKLLALYNHINELVQLQEVAPPLDANKDLVHLLTVRSPWENNYYVLAMCRVHSTSFPIHCQLLFRNGIRRHKVQLRRGADIVKQ